MLLQWFISALSFLCLWCPSDWFIAAFSFFGLWCPPPPIHTVKLGSSDHTKDICIAYEALSTLNPRYVDSPPELFNLLNVPYDPKKREDIDMYNVRILVAIERKKRGQKDQVIDTWNKVGVVLLDVDVLKIYTKRVMGERDRGVAVRKLCETRWRDKGIFPGG